MDNRWHFTLSCPPLFTVSHHHQLYQQWHTSCQAVKSSEARNCYHHDKRRKKKNDHLSTKNKFTLFLWSISDKIWRNLSLDLFWGSFIKFTLLVLEPNSLSSKSIRMIFADQVDYCNKWKNFLFEESYLIPLFVISIKIKWKQIIINLKISA